jgi:hypothetical protein
MAVQAYLQCVDYELGHLLAFVELLNEHHLVHQNVFLPVYLDLVFEDRQGPDIVWTKKYLISKLNGSFLLIY